MSVPTTVVGVQHHPPWPDNQQGAYSTLFDRYSTIFGLARSLLAAAIAMAIALIGAIAIAIALIGAIAIAVLTW